MSLINRKTPATLIFILCCLPKTMKWTLTQGQGHSGCLKHTEHKSTPWLSSPLPNATPLFTWQEWHTPRQGHINISAGRRSCSWGGFQESRNDAPDNDAYDVVDWTNSLFSSDICISYTHLPKMENSLVSKAGSDSKSIYNSLDTWHFIWDRICILNSFWLFKGEQMLIYKRAKVWKLGEKAE